MAIELTPPDVSQFRIRTRTFDDGLGIVCFPGDVLPTIHHVGFPFNMGYDVLPYQNMLSKKTLLERAAGDGWRLVLDHEPEDPVVRVNRDPDRAGHYKLEPCG